MVLLYLVDTALWELVVYASDHRYTITAIIVLGIADTAEAFSCEAPTLQRYRGVIHRPVACRVSNRRRFYDYQDP